MGRELKRIALDFKWEIGKLWEGYVNPNESHKCPSCSGAGYNKATDKIADGWYNLDGPSDYIDLPNNRRFDNNAWQYHLSEIEVKALVASGRLMDFTRVPINDKQRKVVTEKIANGGNSWLPYDNGKTPTPDEVNEWAKTGLGHDGINQHVCVKARATALGVYGLCPECNGDGYAFNTPEIKKLHEEWGEYDPPKGAGFQLWSTTTEGHPMTPVCSSLNALCEYCAKLNVSVFGYDTATKAEWFQFFRNEFKVSIDGTIKYY